MRALRWMVPAVALIVAVVLILLLTATSSHTTKRSLPPGTLAGGGARLPVLTSAGATPSAGDLGDPYLLAVRPSAGTRVTTCCSAPAMARERADRGLDRPEDVDPHRRRDARRSQVVDRDRYHSRIWAPAVRAGRVALAALCHGARHASGRQCIAVASSTRPEGPYVDAIGKPLVCQASLGGSIDPPSSRHAGGHSCCCGRATATAAGCPRRSGRRGYAGRSGRRRGGPPAALRRRGVAARDHGGAGRRTRLPAVASGCSTRDRSTTDRLRDRHRLVPHARRARAPTAARPPTPQAFPANVTRRPGDVHRPRRDTCAPSSTPGPDRHATASTTAAGPSTWRSSAVSDQPPLKLGW